MEPTENIAVHDPASAIKAEGEAARLAEQRASDRAAADALAAVEDARGQAMAACREADADGNIHLGDEARAAIELCKKAEMEIKASRGQPRRSGGREYSQIVKDIRSVVNGVTKDVAGDGPEENPKHGVLRATHAQEYQNKQAKKSFLGIPLPGVEATPRPRVDVIGEDDPRYHDALASMAGVKALEGAAGERVGVHAEQRRNAAKTQSFGTGKPSEKDDVGAKVTRAVRRTASGGRTQINSVVHEVGVIDEQAYKTAQDLERQAAGAQTEAEYQYIRQERLDAYARRAAGKTFLGQEIDQNLAALQKTEVGKKISSNNWAVNMTTSQVVDRLKENGYIKGERTWWNPFAHDDNAKWSDDAVKRMDRNRDGQLSAEEIAYAMTHKYGVVQAAGNMLRAAEHKADDYGDKGRDLAVAKTVLGKQVNPMLADFQKFTWTYDTDKDGKVELHEVVAVLKAKGIHSIKDMDKDGDIDIKDVDAMIRAQNKGQEKPQKGK